MKLPLPPIIAAVSIFATQLLTPPASFAALPFQQYDTAEDIPSRAFQQNDRLYGRVERVIDGDTMRIRHYPFYPFQRQNAYRDTKNENKASSSSSSSGAKSGSTNKLSDNTISVRLYGIDAPEIGKFGKPSMEYAQEAKEFTQSLVDGKVVQVKLLRRDQYSRVVGKVTLPGPIPIITNRKDVSIELAKEGLATLYTGAGAEYDDSKKLLQDAIAEAQKKRRGLWSNGEKNVQSPSEYKRAIRNGELVTQP